MRRQLLRKRKLRGPSIRLREQRSWSQAYSLSISRWSRRPLRHSKRLHLEKWCCRLAESPAMSPVPLILSSLLLPRTDNTTSSYLHLSPKTRSATLPAAACRDEGCGPTGSWRRARRARRLAVSFLMRRASSSAGLQTWILRISSTEPRCVGVAIFLHAPDPLTETTLYRLSSGSKSLSRSWYAVTAIYRRVRCGKS